MVLVDRVPAGHRVGILTGLVVFLTIIAVFVVRARVINRAAAVETPVTADRRPLRVPPQIAHLFVVRRSRLLHGVVGLVVGLVVPHLPYFTPRPTASSSLILVYALVGVAVTIVVGWAGQVRLGHFALVRSSPPASRRTATR